MPRLCIDFDGTICKWKYPYAGKPQPHVKEVLTKLKKRGFYISILSCRTSKELHEGPNAFIEKARHAKIIEDYMKEYDLPYDEILYDYDKPIAMYYIDDQAIQFKGDWNDVLKEIENKE